MELTDPKNIKALLEKYQFNVKKFLGQNFLISPKTLQKIVETADISEDEEVIEVGPGLGVLTQELAKKTTKLKTIELDTTLLPLLKDTLPEHVELIHQDALLYAPPRTPYKVVANIPYNITSPLINHFLQADNPPLSMTILIQKEVAEKICQKEPDMTVLSLQVALFADAKIVKQVANTCFYPAPKVDSAVIHLNVHNKIPRDEAQKILKLAKQAFLNRRKKLSNTLKPHLEALKTLDIQDQRPQHLTIDQWRELCKMC